MDGPLQRAIDGHPAAQAITHRTYTYTGTDSRDDPTFSDSTETVQAQVERIRQSRIDRDERGDEIAADITIYVKDSVDITETGGTNSRADEFVVDGTDYVVLRADADAGLIACDCQRSD